MDHSLILSATVFDNHKMAVVFQRVSGRRGRHAQGYRWRLADLH